MRPFLTNWYWKSSLTPLVDALIDMAYTISNSHCCSKSHSIREVCVQIFSRKENLTTSVTKSRHCKQFKILQTWQTFRFLLLSGKKLIEDLITAAVDFSNIKIHLDQLDRLQAKMLKSVRVFQAEEVKILQLYFSEAHFQPFIRKYLNHE